ncbi:hypothetical protein [Thiothrix lacustris]|nr:hypothetical protein [Thiothrix lacustris]
MENVGVWWKSSHASAESEHALLVLRNIKDFPEYEPWLIVPCKR